MWRTFSWMSTISMNRYICENIWIFFIILFIYVHFIDRIQSDTTQLIFYISHVISIVGLTENFFNCFHVFINLSLFFAISLHFSFLFCVFFNLSSVLILYMALGLFSIDWERLKLLIFVFDSLTETLIIININFSKMWWYILQKLHFFDYLKK